MSAPAEAKIWTGLVAIGSAALVGIAAFSGGAFDVVTRQTVGLVLWWVVALLALIVPGGPRRPGADGVVLTLLALGITAWTALGLGITISTERTAVELARWIVHLAPLVLLGWVLPRGAWRPAIVGAAVGGVAICVVGFVERLWPGTFEDVTTVVFSNTAFRLSTPLGYWNALGSWGVMTALLLVALAAHLPSRIARALALLPLPMVALVVYVTYSRSALATLLVGVLALVVLARNRWSAGLLVAAVTLAAVVVAQQVAGLPTIAEPDPLAGPVTVDASARSTMLIVVVAAGLLLAAAGALSRRIDDIRMPTGLGRGFGIGATAIAVIAIAAVGVSRGPDLWDRFTVREGAQTGTASRLTQLENGSRVEQWRVALDAYDAHPARGQGAGTFELIYNQTAPDGQFVRDAHSAPLEALAEQGWPGFALLIGFMLGAVWVAVAALRRVGDAALDRGLVAGAGAAAGAFLVGTGFDWFWEVTALPLLALVLVGALIAAGAPERAPARALARRPARVVAALVAAAAAVSMLPGLIGTSEIRRSQADVEAGQLDAARRHADDAIELQPWASSPYLQRALVDERAGQLGAAVRGLELAIERDPQDWRLPLVLSRVQARNGKPRAALEAYRRAKALRPEGQFFR